MFYVMLSLSLVLVDTVKAVPQEECFFAFLQVLYVLKWLNIQKEMYDGAPRELQRLSETRWAFRHVACCSVLNRLPAIIHVLEEIAAKNSKDRAVDVLAQIDLQFIRLFFCALKFFGDSLTFFSPRLLIKVQLWI